ncbi:proline-rich transmembrane protein 4-like isoform X2 [Teleopsis dalmanni]|uniref:proline-rich transmembrane protein 4-like isoform X2 n=1 Tax=Teleopsis dalmanni TaxID=139649 RepID=UPI0018CEEFEF|nr:proline-rich transmembrane protein 4-like isoform X2 [Teleopsis dalmanni]
MQKAKICPDEGDPYVVHCPAHCPKLKDPTKRACGGVDSYNLGICPDAGNPSVVHCPARCPSLRAAANATSLCGSSNRSRPITPSVCRDAGPPREINLRRSPTGYPNLYSGGAGGGSIPKIQLQDEYGRIGPCPEEVNELPCPPKNRSFQSPCPAQASSNLLQVPSIRPPRRPQSSSRRSPRPIQSSPNVSPCPAQGSTQTGTQFSFDCTAVIHIDSPNGGAMQDMTTKLILI